MGGRLDPRVGDIWASVAVAGHFSCTGARGWSATTRPVARRAPRKQYMRAGLLEAAIQRLGVASTRCWSRPRCAMSETTVMSSDTMRTLVRDGRSVAGTDATLPAPAVERARP